jgi:hypothetical protein
MTLPTEDKQEIRETIENAGDERLIIGETHDDRIILLFDGNQAILSPEDALQLAEVMRNAAENLLKKQQKPVTDAQDTLDKAMALQEAAYNAEKANA